MPRRQSLAAWTTKYLRPTDGPGTGARLALETVAARVPARGRPGAQTDRQFDGWEPDRKNRYSPSGSRFVQRSTARACCWRLPRKISIRGPCAPTRQHARTRADTREAVFRRLGPGQARARVGEIGGSSGAGGSDSRPRAVPRSSRAGPSRIALADEVSRWPARVRSGEGTPARLAPRAAVGTGVTTGCLLAISSPVHPDRLDCPATARRRPAPDAVYVPGLRTAGRRSDGSKWSVVTVASSP